MRLSHTSAKTVGSRPRRLLSSDSDTRIDAIVSTHDPSTDLGHKKEQSQRGVGQERMAGGVVRLDGY
jgi:hypothetical protein